MIRCRESKTTSTLAMEYVTAQDLMGESEVWSNFWLKKIVHEKQ